MSWQTIDKPAGASAHTNLPDYDAARVCNLGDDLGTLEPGKIADILVVSGDPLQDLQALLNPAWVIHSGVVIRTPDPSPAPTPGP